MKHLLKKADWVSFAVNFLAVVLGIAITFICEGLISRHNEEKRAKEILTLVRDELVSDVEGLEQFKQSARLRTDAMNYLLSYVNNPDAVPEDSLVHFGTIAISPSLIVMNNVAEGLLSSSDFQNGLKDNSLKLSIAEAYVLLSGAAESFNMVSSEILSRSNQAQNEEFRKKVFLDKYSNDVLFFKQLLYSPDGVFLLRSSDGTQIQKILTRTQEEVREIIEKINSYLER